MAYNFGDQLATQTLTFYNDFNRRTIREIADATSRTPLSQDIEILKNNLKND